LINQIWNRPKPSRKEKTSSWMFCYR
jgi:hypothetical protein